MEDIFLKLFNMSITAGWLILAISVIRFIFKKAPKWIFCVMWGLVGIRLLLPFSFESILSLIPSSQTVPSDIMYTSAPEIHSGIPALNSVINPVIAETFTPADLSASTANPIQTLITVFSYIWITVTCIMLIYALLSYIALKLKVRTATKLYGNIRQCENVDSPFVLGIIKPLIYLPYSIEEEDCSLVIEHENAHIKRRDHLIKPFAFLLLSIYWFNPLIWAAYILLCRDIEIACDEKVLKKIGSEKKKVYSTALLNCAINRRYIAACPIAFGEVGVKTRIKSIMNYKKPAFWIILISIILCIIFSVCFLSDPPTKDPNSFSVNPLHSSSEFPEIHMSFESILFDSWDTRANITLNWENTTSKTVTVADTVNIYRYEKKSWTAVYEREYRLQGEYLETVRANGTLTYTYAFDDDAFTEPGIYRAEMCFLLNSQQYKANVYFELYDNTKARKIVNYKTSALVYEEGMFSFSLNGAEFCGRIINDSILQYTRSDTGTWDTLGIMEEITLTEANFDNLFSDYSYNKEADFSQIRKNSKKTYVVYGDNDTFYYILLQKNSDAYITVGYENLGSNQDSLLIRWMFKAEQVDEDDNKTYKASNLYSEYFSERKDLIIDTEYFENGKDLIIQAEQLPIKKIDSAEQLNDFIDKYSVNFSALADLTAQYDDNFFNKNSLFIICIFANHPDQQFAVEYVSNIGKNFSVLVSTSEPETDLPGERDCFITVETSKKSIENCSEFRAVLTYNIKEKIYVYRDGPETISPKITLSDNTFDFSYSTLSSYIPAGLYSIENNTLTLSTNDELYTYVFDIDGDDLIFNASKSSEIPTYKYSQNSEAESPVPDGAVFSLVN